MKARCRRCALPRSGPPAGTSIRKPFPPSASCGISGNQRGKPVDEMQVFVRDNDINSALRVLKRKMQREGLFGELRRRRSYEKPSQRRNRELAEGVRRRRKAMRKRMIREGY